VVRRLIHAKALETFNQPQTSFETGRLSHDAELSIAQGHTWNVALATGAFATPKSQYFVPFDSINSS